MTSEPHEHEYDDANEYARSVWRGYLTGDGGEQYARFTQAMRAIFSRLPAEPRCKICRAPFRGVGSVLARTFGFAAVAWQMNPNLCDRCEVYVRKHEVGVEIDLTMLFADVRGSTALAERMGLEDFHHLIDRFYRTASGILLSEDALIEKLIGDEVAGLFVPGVAGPDYSRRAVRAAQRLMVATGHGPDVEPWVEIGAGVHHGRAYVGAVGSEQSTSVITVLGEAANLTARLASTAAAGEVLITEAARRQAGLELADCEQRDVEFRGGAEPVSVRVMLAGSATLTA